MNNTAHCPVCGKPYWPYDAGVTTITVCWQGSIRQTYTSAPDYCTGHIYSLSVLSAPEKKTPIPEVFYETLIEGLDNL